MCVMKEMRGRGFGTGEDGFMMFVDLCLRSLLSLKGTKDVEWAGWVLFLDSESEGLLW